MEESTQTPVTQTLSDLFNMSSLFPEVDPYDQLQSVLEFFRTIEWSEPWLIALVSFHVLITTLNLITRRRATMQGFLFLIMLLLVFLSENINEFAAENWAKFSKHQYFDSEGMFISMVFSLPLLFNCMLLVVNWLLISSELMTNLRRFQLQQKIRAERKRSGSGSGSGDASTSNSSKKNK